MQDGGAWSWIEARSGGEIGADDRTENNRRARFYRLSAKGRSHLEAEADTWRRYAQSVETVLGADA